MLITWLAIVLALPSPTAVPESPMIASLVGASQNDDLTSTPATCSAVIAERKDRTLQRNLERAMAADNLTRYTSRHRLAVAVVDVTRADETYYAGVNDDQMMYAASLPKIAILLANAQAAADGQLDWTAEHDRRLSAMITESNNADATWGAALVGYGGIESVMRDPRYCLYDNVHGGLWVGRGYAPSADTSPDPVRHLVHGATARQTARFYMMLNNRELVSKEWSDHMLALMGPPKHQHKFVHGLADRGDVTFVARKSGTWKSWHADSALIQHGENRYVVVALAEARSGEAIMQKVVRVIDDLIASGKHRRSQRVPRA